VIAPSTSSIDVDWWPMFRHDSGNTGCSSSKAPNTNTINWQENIGNEIYTGIPIIVEDKLYISTNWYYNIQLPGSPGFQEKPPSPLKIFEALSVKKEEYFGGIYCLDADTGLLLWDCPMFAPNNPAVINGKVFATETNYYTYYSSLFCLNAETGDYVWQEPIYGWVTSSTIVDDEKIYLGCIDFYGESGKFHCFDLNGNSLWTYTMPPSEFMFFTTPAVYDSRVYFYTIDLYTYNEGNLYCLDAETGQFLWSKSLFSWWYWMFGTSSPVCANGKVFAVDIDFYGYSGQLICFDAVTGNQQWSYNIGWSFTSPAFCDNCIFITGIDYYSSYFSSIYCIDATAGTLIWEAPLPEYMLFSSSPVVADNKIYILPSYYYYYYSQNIYCLDADDGSIIWSYLLDFPTMSSPSIANEHIYIPDSMGNIYAFKTNFPPSTPSIDGQINGKFGKPYEYTFKSVDPDGDDVYYLIYWGDGTIVTWNGPHPSGEELTISHTWAEKDTYAISAKAKDGYGKQSDWEKLEVTMPKNQISADLSIMLLLDKLTQHFPLLARIFYLIYSNGNTFFRIGGIK
jgi:outer membrane protein assembly factor BamB